MHISNRPIKLMMAGILSMLAIAACKVDEDNPFVPFDQQADHTLLMYMEGDNSLTNEIENNVIQAHKAIRDSVASGKINLLVYKDNRKTNDNHPKLYWVHGNMKHGLDTVMIKQWSEDLDSDSPSHIAEVMNTAFSRFDTSIKGMVFASHSAGWVPMVNNRNYSAPRPAFGADEDTGTGVTGSCELWDLSDAMLRGPMLDYVILDCCHMGNAEVAYELRDVTRYLVASAAEVQGAGMPYLNVVTRLSKCTSANDLPAALDYAAACYYFRNAPYNSNGKQGATIAVYDLQDMEQLANSYQQLIATNTDRLQKIVSDGSTAIVNWVENFQPYGREAGKIHYKYYFYDLKDMIEWFGQNNTSAAAQARLALDQIVLSEYHSTQFYAVNIGRSCGMAVTIPETLVLDSDPSYTSYFKPFAYTKLQAAYHHCDWGQKMGY